MNESDLATIALMAHASEPLVKKGAEFLEYLLGEPMKIAGGMIGDQIYTWRIMRAAKLASDCQDVLKQRGVEARQLPPSFLIPFLDSAINADESLHGLWTNLLASAVESDESMHPVLQNLLSEMTTIEARLLRWIWVEGYLPVILLQSLGSGVAWTRPESIDLPEDCNVTLALSNLSRMGMINVGGQQLLKLPDSFSGMADDQRVHSLIGSMPKIYESGGNGAAVLTAYLNPIGHALCKACAIAEEPFG